MPRRHISGSKIGLMMAGQDIRDLIFFKVRGKKYLAHISVQGDGILSGTQWLRRSCETLGIRLRKCKKEGERVRPSEIIAILEGDPKQMALGEEEIMGWISKASGIATAAWKAKSAANNIKVVSGAWKKMPLPMKQLVRQAIADGGIHYRISEKPFIYLDKNYVKILGGVPKTLLSMRGFKHLSKVIQLKSQGKKLLKEAVVAAQLGANIIMIDTGRKEDIKKVDLVLRKQKLRHKVKIAFGGDVTIEDLRDIRKMPVEIIDIGKAIVDAPLMDVKMDIVGRAG